MKYLSAIIEENGVTVSIEEIGGTKRRFSINVQYQADEIEIPQEVLRAINSALVDLCVHLRAIAVRRHP